MVADFLDFEMAINATGACSATDSLEILSSREESCSRWAGPMRLIVPILCGTGLDLSENPKNQGSKNWGGKPKNETLSLFKMQCPEIIEKSFSHVSILSDPPILELKYYCIHMA